MKPLVSVIIPTFNRSDAIGLTLEHLAQQSLGSQQYEVFVIDDGSTDETEAIIESTRWPYPFCFVKQANRGAAAARNLGVSLSSAPIVLFLDSDVVPDRLLLETHLNSHSASERIIVVGRIKNWPQTPHPWFEKCAEPGGTGMDYGDTEFFLPAYMTLGGNLSLSRTAFVEIGGYDEGFPAAGCEETEFAYRGQEKGFLFQYQPQAIGHHNHPRTLMQRCQQQQSHMRSMALLIYKHPELQAEIFGVDELMPLWSAPKKPSHISRRVRSHILGMATTRLILERALSFLERRQAYPRLTSALYWRLHDGWRHVGFREGLRLYRCFNEEQG